MKRIHLFEFGDQPWLPVSLRDAETNFLRFALRAGPHVPVLADILSEVMRRTRVYRIVDLCTGASGPIVPIVNELLARGLPVTAELTDLYPNEPGLAAAAAEGGGRITYSSKPTDATAVDPQRVGVRTLFNGFHHFRPPEARRILDSAVQARAPIAVFELVGRYPAALKGACTVGFKIPLLAPQLRPFSWRTLAWTYLIPALPWVIFWDALVSCLRVYSQAELGELTRSLSNSSYRWHIGTVHLESSQQQALYLWGAPEELLQDGKPA